MSEQMEQQKPEFPIDAGLILPRIKHLNFLAGLSQAGVPPEQLPITEPLVGDLVVAYAFDFPSGFMMVRPEDAAQLNVAQDQLRKLSLDNLKKQMPQIAVEAQGDGEVRRIMTGNHLEACTLLAQNFWKTVASQIAGEIVAVVPSRDVVLFCSSQSSQGIESMATMAREVFQGAAGHALSDQFYVWRDGWRVIEERVTK